MLKLELGSLPQFKRTPRKSSVDPSNKHKYNEKLRSNSSFKKEKNAHARDDKSPSPTVFRDRSTSKVRLDKSKSRQAGVPGFAGIEFVPLVRKNTKNSDTIGYGQQKKGSVDYETEDFFSHIAKSCKPADRFDSKCTLSLSKSTTVVCSLTENESWMINKLRPETKLFCSELEKLFSKAQASKQAKAYETKNADWESVKRIIVSELDELFVPFSDIEVSKVIGNGATSCVHVGNYRFCSVAVKKIKLTSLSPKQLANIVNEASFLKKINHPNVISIYALSIDQQQNLYLITELCEQLSVKSFFKKFKQKIPSAVKIRIIFDVAKALFHIHGDRLAITHRDIKPENVLLTGDLKAKLADFGIAKNEDSQEKPAQACSDEKLDTIATLHYMAPECILRGQYSSSSDIYSFGVLAWEILHEREAFEGLSEYNMIDSIVKNKYALDFEKGSVPEEVASLLKSCLSVTPEDRPTALKICSKLDETIKSSKK